jgi:helicase
VLRVRADLSTQAGGLCLKLEELPINKRVISLLQGLGTTSLFPTQELAFDSGVLSGKNLVLAVPTSSGKTLVAEVCMLKSILEGNGKALYLVPLKSLAHEKYMDFKKYEPLGITIAVSVGDYDSKGTNLREADIVILTTERADSLIRQKTSWMDEVGILVVDEVHLVNDPSRGPTLEMVLAKIGQMLPSIQIVALSATISNADDIAGWLEADLVRSDWRPVKLNEGVYSDGTVQFNDLTFRHIPRKRSDEVSDLACDILDENGQVLIFVSSRKSTIAVAKKLSSSIRPYLDSPTLDALSKIAAKLDKGASAPESTKTLAKMIAHGIAFHHAGLTNVERTVVEGCFRDNLLKVIVATPTLAAGVNLPARRVIIRDYRRFEQYRGNHPIPVLEYKQMAGRAGRPKYDNYGEAVLFARSEDEREFLMDYYVHSEPEKISSKLASPLAVQTHLLSAIASEMTQTRGEIDCLIDKTFFSYQFERWELDHIVTSALDYLVDGGLVETEGTDRFTATPLGNRASRLYIAPSTAILFRDALVSHDTISEMGILHLICASDDQPITYVTQSELEDYEFLLETHQEEFLVEPPDSWDEPEAYTAYLAQIKTARLLQDWISEKTEREMTDLFNVGMGDVHRYVQSAEWLLYSATEIVRVSNMVAHLPKLHPLRTRMKHGVREDLLELVGLKGIGRIRARMLYSHDLHTLSDLYQAEIEKIANVPFIGTAVAQSVKRQLGVEISQEPNHDELEDYEDDTGTQQTLLEDFE